MPPARTMLVASMAAAVMVVGSAAPTAAGLPAGFSDTLVASVESPTAVAFPPDGRLFVTTQFGEVRIVSGGALVAQPALDLSTVLCTADEEGLLGIAVDPAFASNGFLYLYYTRDKGATCVNRVSRFTMSGATVDPASELVVVDEIPATGNHNGGDLHFGRDGYLYISVGDGGCDYANDSGCAGANDASRDRHVLVGKILRVTSTGEIPPSNPFQGAGTARCNVTGRTTAGTRCQETYAWGLRNPFRIAFDPNAAGTRFFVNDVGQNQWEEIDEASAGADYGWNVREGPCVNGSTTSCGAPPAGMTNPVYSYSHDESACHAITGGAFVPNGIWPAAYDGAYLYGDYTCGKVFVLAPNGSGGFTKTEFSADVGAVINLAFGPSPAGQALYYTNYTNGGEVRRIERAGTGNRPPTASLTAAPTSGPLPLAVSFDAGGSSDPDAGDTLSYTWSYGDGTPDETTTASSRGHTYSKAGTFTASVTVRDNHGAAATASVLIDAGNTPPTATIDSPSATARFAVGDTVTLHGTASDAQDGPLPASALSWRVLRRHDTHTHPFLAPTPGNDVQIVGPSPEDLAAASNSDLEIQLTATDSRGLSTTVTRILPPKKVDLTFATSPTGLAVEVNGGSVVTPRTLTSWEGYVLAVSALPQTDGGGQSWVFQSWSDGGAASHSIVTPASPATYSATFAKSAAPAGLVAAYGFGEGQGPTVGDRSGRGNNGSISGAVWSTAGKFGSALSFNGSTSWVTVPDSASLDLTNAFTLESWARPSALGGWRTIVFKERPGGVVYSLYANQNTDRPVGQVFINGEQNALGPATLPLNTWTHLAVSFDGSALKLYVNGALAGTRAITGAAAPSTGVLRIGGNSIWSEWFAGLIDEVRLYNRALTTSEIQQDMQTPVG